MKKIYTIWSYDQYWLLESQKTEKIAKQCNWVPFWNNRLQVLTKNIIFEKFTFQSFKRYIGLILKKSTFYWILDSWINFWNMKNRVVGSDWFTQDLGQLITDSTTIFRLDLFWDLTLNVIWGHQTESTKNPPSSAVSTESGDHITKKQASISNQSRCSAKSPPSAQSVPYI